MVFVALTIARLCLRNADSAFFYVGFRVEETRYAHDTETRTKILYLLVIVGYHRLQRATNRRSAVDVF